MRNRVWKELPFSQGELEQAARIAGQAITDALPEDCLHTFSPEFQQKMEELTGKTDRSGWGMNLRRAACFFLVLFVGGMTWITVEAQVSQQAYGWDRETAPEVLYQEYTAIVEKANETYDVDLSLAPLEEMDPERMPSAQRFRNDVNEMVETVEYIETHSGVQESDRGVIDRIYRKLLVSSEYVWGAGERTMDIETYSYARELGIQWSLSPVILVNTAPGTPSYYIGDVTGGNMTPVALPEGCRAEPNGEFWYGRSYNLKTCTIYQKFTLTWNHISAAVVPWVVIQVDRNTGGFSLGTAEGLYQEYLDMVEKVNEEYGTNVYIEPFESMDPSDMPSLKDVEEAARDLAKLEKGFREQSRESEREN